MQFHVGLLRAGCSLVIPRGGLGYTQTSSAGVDGYCPWQAATEHPHCGVQTLVGGRKVQFNPRDMSTMRSTNTSWNEVVRFPQAAEMMARRTTFLQVVPASSGALIIQLGELRLRM